MLNPASRLKEDRMRAVGRRVGAAGIALLVLLGAAASVAAQDNGGPTVTPSIQINQDFTPGRAHSEPQLNVNPVDPNILAVVEAEFQSSTCLVYISRDRGRTWAPTPRRPMPEQYKSCARPSFGPFLAAKFGADGTLYVAATGAETATNSGPTDPYVARSRDLGETWQFAIIKRAEEREFAKQDGSTVRDVERFNYARLATHPTDPKRVYAGFRRQGATLPTSEAYERSVISVSTDGGVTFTQPTDVYEPTFPLAEVKGSDAPAMGVDKDGVIYTFTKERPPAGGPAAPQQGTLPKPLGPANTCQAASANPAAPTWVPTPTTVTPPVPGRPGAGARLLMSKSTDDGRTWKASVVDTSGIVCGPCLTTPEAAVDPTTGAVYVVFEQSDQGPPNPRDDRNIWFMKSTDGGQTWSPRKQLNDDSVPTRNPNYDQFFPGISVAPNGRVDVAWWDFRTDALFNPAGNGNTTRRDQTCFDIYYTSSSDGGNTWAKNSRISDRTMNQNEGFAMNLCCDLRGPVGVASTDEAAYVAWSDSRAGRMDLPQEDVYFASVIHAEPKVETSGVRAGSVFLGTAIGAVVVSVLFLLVAAGLRRRRPA
jgi:hypothetical protein